MLVHDLVETKQLLVGETKPNYYVVYEKVENNAAIKVRDEWQTKRLGTEEMVQIFQGSESLQKIKTYSIGKEYSSIADILEKVKNTHKEIFN